jgi:GNAT superfamily N-acetyltransferase
MNTFLHERHGERLAEEALIGALLTDVACGRFPPADGGVTVVPQPSERDAGVLGFTAHAVIFTDADPDWVRQQLPPGDLAAPLNSAFLQKLAAATGRRAGSLDVLCVTESLEGQPPVELTPEPASTHSRVLRALNYRDEVKTWRADGGIVLIGRGVGGRLETAIEVHQDRRGQGLGKRLAMAARHLIPAQTTLWAQIAPANAASLRAFLAAGFVPVGAEVLLSADPHYRTTPAARNDATMEP